MTSAESERAAVVAKDRGCLFSAPMVRALHGDRKTQTRRLGTSPLRRVEIGDRLWVRETWRVAPDACEGWPPQDVPCRGWIDYRAGGDAEVSAPSFSHVLDAFGKSVDVDWDALPDNWRPSIFMPRWASRLTLIVEDKRFQRLQDISEKDAKAEGTTEPTLRALGGALAQAAWSERQVYKRLWDSLHTKPGERWADNPEIVALTFRVVRANIDALERGDHLKGQSDG